MTILIVEDDRTNQALLGYQAEDVDFPIRIVTAEDGEEALHRMVQAGPVGLILLDLGMPRMDGFEFMARLRQMGGHAATPVIVVTARDLTSREHEVLRGLGVSRVLQKGRYDTASITDAITELTQ